MIYVAHVDEMSWLTLVVRAGSEKRAIEIATAAAREYGEPGDVRVLPIDPDGPEGVVVEDSA